MKDRIVIEQVYHHICRTVRRRQIESLVFGCATVGPKDLSRDGIQAVWFNLRHELWIQVRWQVWGQVENFTNDANQSI